MLVDKDKTRECVKDALANINEACKSLLPIGAEIREEFGATSRATIEVEEFAVLSIILGATTSLGLVADLLSSFLDEESDDEFAKEAIDAGKLDELRRANESEE